MVGRGRVQILFFVVMGNHWHLGVYVPDDASLSKFMHLLKTDVACYMNEHLERRGAFWHGRYSAMYPSGRVHPRMRERAPAGQHPAQDRERLVLALLVEHARDVADRLVHIDELRHAATHEDACSASARESR